MLYARSLPECPKENWQTLVDHLTGVGAMAHRFAKTFCAEEWGITSGLIHDLGKCQASFQKRLDGSGESVNHTGPGARWVHEQIKGVGKLLAYTVLGHHGGMPDGASGITRDLEQRLKDAEDIGPHLPEDIVALLGTLPTLRTLRPPIKPYADCRVSGFQMAFFTRMVFSCLVDADFLDTERALNPEKFDARLGTPSLKVLKSMLDQHMQGFKPDSHINQKRHEVLRACLEAADKEPGFFSLNVPTGGGKTLASMAFALKHADRYGLRRIIYVIPYTSIIEQNAKVFRDVLGQDSVVEHHSNFSPDPEENDQRMQTHRLASENWDAPVVVTTNVQFFESLFANKPSRCRKLHNIAGSVIILDEAQMLPQPYLTPCLAALRELAHNYNASIVLCTATPPDVEKGPHLQEGLPQNTVREIIPDPAALHDALRRTSLEFMEEQSDGSIAQAMEHQHQALCIVNTRKRAADIFSLLEKRDGTFHLSARMCPAHRKDALNAVRSLLKDKESCRVVATQLVEAGVDVSFPLVFREMAGLDSICQAAGRCNRHGEMENSLGKVKVFKPEDGKTPKMFRRNIAAAESALRQKGDDPFSPETLRLYFREAYWLCDSLDEKGIMEKFEESAKSLLFPFRTVAESFRIIENEMRPVLVPWNATAEKLIEELHWVTRPSKLLRSLQAYTVQIYPHEFRKLMEKGAINMVNGVYPALTTLDPWYSMETGLVVDAQADPETFIF